MMNQEQLAQTQTTAPDLSAALPYRETHHEIASDIGARSFAQSIRETFASAAPHSIMQSPAGFIDLFEVAKLGAHIPDRELGDFISAHLMERDWKSTAQPLNLGDPGLAHYKIYGGENYYEKGPVLVNPKHMQQIFPAFQPPSASEIAERVQIGKDMYGTMPGIECAYTGAIVKAVQPRTIFIIGEHRGALTDYIARCAPQDCIIMTLDLAQSQYGHSGVRPPDKINQNYITYSQDQIGEVWRNSGQAYSDRIIGFLGDSTHPVMNEFYVALKGKIDLMIVDGSHEFDQVLSDLVVANIITSGGPILLDDFWKPARLFEVTEAALTARREIQENLKYLHHVSWGFGGDDEKVTSNLAFFIGDQK